MPDNKWLSTELSSKPELESKPEILTSIFSMQFSGREDFCSEERRKIK